MFRHFILDGNNLIGYNKELKKSQNLDKQNSRESLVIMIQKYFHSKKDTVSLYFDGYEKGRISSGKVKIFYSNNKTADDLIRNEITKAKNARNICLVSSDMQLCEFAKKNSCMIKSSNDFWEEYFKKPVYSEKENVEKIISNAEMMKLFGIK